MIPKYQANRVDWTLTEWTKVPFSWQYNIINKLKKRHSRMSDWESERGWERFVCKAKVGLYENYSTDPVKESV